MKSHEDNFNAFYAASACNQQRPTNQRYPEQNFAMPLPSGSEIENTIDAVMDKHSDLTSLLHYIRNTPLCDQQKQSLANQLMLNTPPTTRDSAFIGGKYLVYANYIAESALSPTEKKDLREDVIFKMIEECKSPPHPESDRCSAEVFENFLSEFKKNHFYRPKENNVMLKHFIEIVILKSCAFCDDKRDLDKTILRIGESSLEPNDKAQLILKLTKEFNRVMPNYVKGHNVKLKEVTLAIKNSSLEEYQKASLIQAIKEEEINEKSKGTSKDKAHFHSFFSRIIHHKHQQSDSHRMCVHP